jgi:DUF971 family protein
MSKSAARHLATSRHTMITSLVLAVLLAAGATSAALLLNVHTFPASARDYPEATDCAQRKTPKPPYVGVALSKPSPILLSQFCTATKVSPNIVEMYVKFSKLGSAFNPQLMSRLTQKGALPLIQINPRKIKLATIVAGKWNRELHAFASAVRKFNHEVAISFGHEMDGGWYSWGYLRKDSTPEIFIKAWRHIHHVFAEEHATKVKWVWTIDRIVRRATGPRRKQVAPARRWWPGPNYVNWIGIDGYFRKPGDSFGKLFNAQLASVREFTRRPVLITETAVPNTRKPAIKTAQIHELFKRTTASGDASASRMLGFIWFDIKAKEDWPIDNDRIAREAFHTDASEYR